MSILPRCKFCDRRTVMKHTKDIYARLNGDTVGALGFDSETEGERYTSLPDGDGGEPKKDTVSEPSQGYRMNADNIYDFSAPGNKKEEKSEGFYTDSTDYYTEPRNDRYYTQSPDMGSSGTYNAGQRGAPAPGGEFTPPDGGVKNEADSQGTTGFVLSLIGLVVSCCCGGAFVIGLVLCIVGMVLCISSKKKTGQFSGLALAGLICAIVGIAVTVIYAIFAVLAVIMEIISMDEIVY